jgi:soluble lytic murein transglycosylase-like protein
MASRYLRALQGQAAPALPGATSPHAYASYSRVVRWYNPALRSAQVDAIVRSVLYFSARYRVDARLVMALIAVESGFHVTAQSPAGAYGLGQLMPATWRAMRVHPGDPVANVYATVRVLKGNLERLGDDPALALAAYNAGRGAVERFTGIPPYRETQWYVYNVLTVYHHFSGGRPES